MNELLQIPSEIQKVSSMANRRLRLHVDTQENLTDEQMSKVMGLLNKFGYFCFLAEKRIDPENVKDLPAIVVDAGEKSPSQKLRAALWVWWDQKGRPTDTFNQFYNSHMEKFTNQVKEKLT